MPTYDKAIQKYFADKQAYDHQQVSSEGSVRRAFGNLLQDTAKTQKWTLIEEHVMKKSGGRKIRVDGVLKDNWQLPYGYWEAKDSKDDLQKEITQKILVGYPTSNIIFEDTRQAVLYQHDERVFTADLTDPKQIGELLQLFYQYSQPDFQGFENAVLDFQAKIPDLGERLKTLLQTAHQSNKKFQAAYTQFFDLCQQSLNPNISREAVDEMLIQHLMTARLMRSVFNNPDFARRNVIAAEVEKVIDALTAQHFSRDDFFKDVERFYVAIENTARSLKTFDEKQHFINTVYERFFQGYSVKVADTHGIVYTPQEIVDFMCAAVEEVLQTEFNLNIYDDEVVILDPATGTGNFIINLMNRIPKHQLAKVYKNQLFANEVMLLPYYVSSLNIEHEYYELMGTYEPFEGLCFVDTLDLAESAQKSFAFMTEKNTERVERQKGAAITVILGNPPYNVGQLNENDNNKNRKYDVIDKRVAATYARDSQASNKNALSDVYVKFFRWATDRLNGSDGIVCFVSNNSFVDQIAFDGMRKHLLQDFTRIYHIDLHGNVRQNPKLSGTTHNVFGIQVGVGITIAIRNSAHAESQLFYHRVPEFWRKEEKLAWLSGFLTPTASFLTPSPSPKNGEGSPKDSLTPPLRFVERGTGGEEKQTRPGGEEKHPPIYTTRELWEKLKPLARQMRHEPTPAEEALWQRLRNRQLNGFKFRRQHPIDRFIVDFYCSEAHLVVEVDGSIHDYTAEQDAVRQTFLEHQGLRVIRFKNEEVLTEMNGVLATINEFLTPSDSFLTPSPSPKNGEGSPKDSLTPPLRFVERGSGGEDTQTRPGGEEKILSARHFHPLTPDSRHTWRIAENADEFAIFLPMGSKETKAVKGLDAQAIFKIYGRGVATSRDEIAYDFDRAKLITEIQDFIEQYNAEVDRYKRAGRPKDVDSFVRYDKIKWSRDLKLDLQRGNYAEYHDSKVRVSLYRPFTKKYLFFDRVLNEEVYVFPSIFPSPSPTLPHRNGEGSRESTLVQQIDNQVICVSGIGNEKDFYSIILNVIPNLAFVGFGGACQCFPFYVYDENGDNRRENITDWALAQFHTHYADEKISKWDIFYYVYGLLHHPGYRERYADNLKRELPRLPFAPDFWAFSHAGKALADLHLGYESAKEYPLTWVENKALLPSFRVEKMRLKDAPPSPTLPPQGEKGETPLALDGRGAGGEGENRYKTYDTLIVNDYLTLKGIPAEAFAYRLGNRSALEWVVDQYQVKTDDRSGITSDPNNPEDERYTVRLVGQVITVSVETVKIVNGLPSEFRA